MEPKEITIPVPWGHIAGIAWGDDKNPIIPAFHGILDNAATFNKLIPHLPKAFRYICIDLPGHGKSSRYPPFMPVYTHSYLIVYKLVLKYFGQERYTLLGHSYGGVLSLWYAQLFPESIEKVIVIDCVAFIDTPPGDTVEGILSSYDKTDRTQPTYTYDEALERLMTKRLFGAMKMEGTKDILSRALIPAENSKFRFSWDQRIKLTMNPLNDNRYNIEVLKSQPIEFPVLLIIAEESDAFHEPQQAILDAYKKHKMFTVQYVKGNHCVHSNNPEFVAPYITKFLLNQKTKL